ncbi:hypothetical protein [Piscirickettsia salmonis]|uniref:hypothetical protein n=1 Tax=Piscirickettsia salmonis TaxID=1238 RepID=UPI0009BC4118|nr:hypothetical protein [Piscirickettsia salmonis]
MPQTSSISGKLLRRTSTFCRKKPILSVFLRFILSLQCSLIFSLQNRRAKRDDYKPSAVRVTQRYVP